MRDCFSTYTRFYTSNPVSHWVNARLCWICPDDYFKLLFTPLQFLFPVDALGLAKIKDQWLRIHPSCQYIFLRIDCHMHSISVVISRRKFQFILCHYYFIITSITWNLIINKICNFNSQNKMTSAANAREKKKVSQPPANPSKHNLISFWC